MRREPRHRIHPTIRQFARELRQPLTPMETKLWQQLRNRNFGYKFRRQHEIEFFIIDFYCAEVKLCIEIDGDTHLTIEQQDYDAARTEYLEAHGRKVIRFKNEDVRYNIEVVIQEILEQCNKLKSQKQLQTDTPLTLALSPNGRGDGVTNEN